MTTVRQVQRGRPAAEPVAAENKNPHFRLRSFSVSVEHNSPPLQCKQPAESSKLPRRLPRPAGADAAARAPRAPASWLRAQPPTPGYEKLTRISGRSESNSQNADRALRERAGSRTDITRRGNMAALAGSRRPDRAHAAVASFAPAAVLVQAALIAPVEHARIHQETGWEVGTSAEGSWSASWRQR